MLQYPFITCGPLMINSPVSPVGSSFVPSSRSTTLYSVDGIPIPTLPGFRVENGGLQCVMGELSESPYPSTIVAPVFFSKFLNNSTGIGALPELQGRILSRPYFSAFGWFVMAIYIVGTPGNAEGFKSLIVCSTSSMSNLGSIILIAPVYIERFMQAVIPKT